MLDLTREIFSPRKSHPTKNNIIPGLLNPIRGCLWDFPKVWDISNKSHRIRENPKDQKVFNHIEYNKSKKSKKNKNFKSCFIGFFIFIIFYIIDAFLVFGIFCNPMRFVRDVPHLWKSPIRNRLLVSRIRDIIF